MDYLQYKTKEVDLKNMGYTYQELYARNYKTYRKKINDYTLWLWAKGKRLEVDDWFHHTGKIIEFFKNNLGANSNLPKMKNAKKRNPETAVVEYMTLHVHKKENTVQFYDDDGYMTALLSKSFEVDFPKFEEKYKDYRKIVIHIPTFMDVLKEVDILTN